MSEERYFVTVDIRSKTGDLADAEQFKKRHGEAAMAFLKDGSGISFNLPVFTTDSEAATKRVLAWAQECFMSPRYKVTIRQVAHAPMAPPPIQP